MRNDKELIQKYNVSGPRYTSYPTVPFWKNNELKSDEWINTIHRNELLKTSKELSLYVHLPFCESLCTFCGCHKRITKNHAVESPYISAVLNEWALYKEKFGFTPEIKELHFGGGTPTFFSIEELLRLLNGLFDSDNVDSKEIQLGFEAHPNNTTIEHLERLFQFGFRRLSLGIQDYSPTVQKVINRIQSFEQVQYVHDLAKSIGYTSISHDLVFGLPKQTKNDIINTIEKTLRLRPDRISLYSYAHVPWIKGNGQRGYDETDLPKDFEKRQLYEVSKELLENAGYIEIGMDHFALAHDELAIAFNGKKLHRNFMGYTTQETSCLIGLGMSAISDSWYGFSQNSKSVEEYQSIVNAGELPIFRGHILSELELHLRQHILDIMCHFETVIDINQIGRDRFEKIKDRLSELINDNLVTIDDNVLRVTNEGVPFVRNICMAFDEDLATIKPDPEKLFSKTV